MHAEASERPNHTQNPVLREPGPLGTKDDGGHGRVDVRTVGLLPHGLTIIAATGDLARLDVSPDVSTRDGR